MNLTIQCEGRNALAHRPRAEASTAMWRTICRLVTRAISASFLIATALGTGGAFGEDIVEVQEDGSAIYSWDPTTVRFNENFLTTSIPPALHGGANVALLIGADSFYSSGYTGTGTVSLNAEAGRIWNGHETLTHVSSFSNHPTAPGAPFSPIAYDRHATWVGMMIGGRMGGPPQSQGISQTGIAPNTDLRSGAIATAWGPSAYAGGFGLTAATADFPYSSAGFGTADVINSSWGGLPTNPAGVPIPNGSPQAGGVDFNAMLIDSLAYRNPHTTSVVAAGNAGQFGTNTVGSPGSGYNSITVGALQNNGLNVYDSVAAFSSHGPQDYRDQVAGLVAGARAPVDIVAPGTALVSSYYGGQTGGNDAVLPGSPSGPLGNPGAYSLGLAGTSFAAPIVTGSVALMDEAAGSRGLPADATDARVIKANLLNAAAKIPGWNNGQFAHPNTNGGMRTTQALDYSSGAGALDMDRTYTQYLLGQTDIAGTTGGSTSNTIGWDYGVVSGVGNSNDIVITTPLAGGSEFRATLDWFRERTYQSATSQIDVGFADLKLEIWDSTFTTLYSDSLSTHNPVEHLAFSLPATGTYGIRVEYAGNLFGSLNSAAYGLAWWGTAVPEPTGIFLASLGMLGLLIYRRSQNSSFVLAGRMAWCTDVRRTTVQSRGAPNNWHLSQFQSIAVNATRGSEMIAVHWFGRAATPVLLQAARKCRLPCAWLLVIASIVLCSSLNAAAVTIDFEVGVHGSAVPVDHYKPVGARFFDARIFAPPNDSWVSVSSGTRGMVPTATTSSIDGVTIEQVRLDHGIAPESIKSLADVLFVCPDTNIPATIGSFTIDYGFDKDGGESVQAIVVEAFDATGARVGDLVVNNLYFDGSSTVSAPSAVRLRLSQFGGVGFDDLSFVINCVPEPTSMGLLAMGLCGMGGFALRRRRHAARTMALLVVVCLVVWDSSARPVAATQIQVSSQSDPNGCDNLVVPLDVDELGTVVFPPDELISAVTTQTFDVACPQHDDPMTPNRLVRMTNLSGRDWTDVWYVADPETSLSNHDGFVNGEVAFKIDSVGNNTPLLTESFSPADGVFQAGETWDFIIDDYSNVFNVPANEFRSLGLVGGLSLGDIDSSGSIIAAVLQVPEPASAVLLCLGVALMGCLTGRRRPS